jgi:hypothetical protein
LNVATSLVSAALGNKYLASSWGIPRETSLLYASCKDSICSVKIAKASPLTEGGVT